MTKDALYTLEELAQTAQITPRAVRYYAAKGLLPGPQSRGRFALYGTAHLNRLRLIAQLKQALLPLAAMRDRMLCLTDAQVAALLTRSEWPTGGSHTPAGDALTEVPPDTVGATLEEQAEAYQYILDALTARPNGDAALPVEPPLAQPARRALFLRRQSEEEKEKRRKGEKETEEQETGNGEGVHAVNMGTEAEVSSFADTRHPIPNTLPLEIWQRVALAPGVELHIREPETPQTRAKLEHLIAEAKSLFEP